LGITRRFSWPAVLCWLAGGSAVGRADVE